MGGFESFYLMIIIIFCIVSMVESVERERGRRFFVQARTPV